MRHVTQIALVGAENLAYKKAGKRNFSNLFPIKAVFPKAA